MRVTALFWLIIAGSALALTPSQSSRLIEIEPDKAWAFDAAGHAWMVPRDPPLALKEWNGNQWITHEVPAGVHCDVGMHVDDQGRIWLNTEWVPIFIFDPKSNEWQTYPDLESAFTAFKAKPVQFVHCPRSLIVQYCADGKRIAYRWQLTGISYYDGTRWQKWGRKEITGVKEMDTAVGPPWFDEQGKVRVNMKNGTSWRLDDSGKWQSVAWESHYPDDIWSEDSRDSTQQTVPPSLIGSVHPLSSVVDNLNVRWMSSDGMLYRAIPDLCVPVFGPDEIIPSQSLRLLAEVYVDQQGNAFLRASVGSKMSRFIIRPRTLPPSETRVRITRKGEDSFIAHFRALSKGAARFRWSLDGSDWSISATDTQTLDHLSNGTHVLHAVAIDDQLNMDNVPAEVKFESYSPVAKPKDVAPATLLTITRESEDSIVAHFDAKTTGDINFRWRLDEGDWHETPDKTQNFDHLPNGPHVLQVVAIDDRQNLDKVPAEEKFEVHVNTAKQIGSLVVQLSNPDYAKRRLAVEALVMQPGNALPILRKARNTANDELRWWIDVAIQECEHVTK